MAFPARPAEDREPDPGASKEILYLDGTTSADPLRAPDEGFVAYVELTAGVSSPAFGVGRGSSALVATLVATSRALNHLRVLAPGALGRWDAAVASAS